MSVAEYSTGRALLHKLESETVSAAQVIPILKGKYMQVAFKLTNKAARDSFLAASRVSPINHPIYNYYLAKSYYELTRRERGKSLESSTWTSADMTALSELEKVLEADKDQQKMRETLVVIREDMSKDDENVIDYVQKARESYDFVLSAEWAVCFLSCLD
jgi:hypothetical protein